MFPARNFFEPNQNFIDWMHNTPWLRYRRIIDCGAGTGFMAYAVNNSRRWKLDIVSIDLHERTKYYSNVEIEDSTDFPFASIDVVFICRPCHSPFIEQTYKNAINSGVVDMFYVGLERNLRVDFDDDWVLENIMDNVGSDGENLYRVYGRDKDFKTFIRVPSPSGFGGDRWAEAVTRSGELWACNRSGGGYPIDPSTILESKQALDIDQIYRADPADFAPHSERAARHMHVENEFQKASKQQGGYGWVGPDGAWWPCGSMDHDTLIYDCFGIDSGREHDLNFIKAYGHFWSCSGPWKTARPNIAQKRTLRQIGFTDLDEEDERGVESLSEKEQEIFSKVMT